MDYNQMTKAELIRRLLLTMAELTEANKTIHYHKNEAHRYHDLWIQELAAHGEMEEGVAKEHSP